MSKGRAVAYGQAPAFHGGDFRLRALSDSMRRQAADIGRVGFLAHEGHSLLEMLGAASVGGTAPTGICILFGEGTWDFGANGCTSSRGRIQLVSLAPSRSILRRTVAPNSRKAIVTLTGADVRICGLRFKDTLGNEPAIILSGSRCVVENCHFEDCYQAVEVGGSGLGYVLRNNIVQAHRFTGANGNAFYLTGTASRGLVLGNLALTATAAASASIIRADDNIGTTAFVGNVDGGGTGFTVDYKSALGNVDAGNTGIINVR